MTLSVVESPKNEARQTVREISLKFKKNDIEVTTTHKILTVKIEIEI